MADRLGRPGPYHWLLLCTVHWPKFAEAKFQTAVNPFGTTYHPFAIHKLLHYVIRLETPPAHSYLENNGVHFNYDLHSSLNNARLTNLQTQLQEHISFVHNYLKKCKVLFLTYGTAWIYERVDNGEAVANCHKMPSSLFTKRLASVEEITKSYETTWAALAAFNPDLRVVLTLSPVRHLKDTLALNSVSKSILRVACHKLTNAGLPVDYFPAYEIMMDDLRDYRFYKSDKIHPSEIAEAYIWQKFSEVYFDPATRHLLKKWCDVQKALAHRPFFAEGNAHKKFLFETLAQLEELKPHIDVGPEITRILSQLKPAT